MTAPVVIVDSNPDGLEMYVTAFALQGIASHAAASGREALDLVERVHPRAVVTDLRLSDTTGSDLIRRVRTTEPGAFIVGLSSNDGPDTVEARAAGCDVVLKLPCLPETLIAQLRGVLA